MLCASARPRRKGWGSNCQGGGDCLKQCGEEIGKSGCLVGVLFLVTYPLLLADNRSWGSGTRATLSTPETEKKMETFSEVIDIGCCKKVRGMEKVAGGAERSKCFEFSGKGNTYTAKTPRVKALWAR